MTALAHALTADTAAGVSAREEAAAFLLGLRSRGVRDLAILRAMELAPREMFAPGRFADIARQGVALPLPCGQTMTSPLVLARMLAELAVSPGQRVLEVGSGSGYLTAVLANLGVEVVSLERMRTLAISAAGRIRRLGLNNATIEHADGLAVTAAGWGRFDRIILNGALANAPESLVDTLVEGGRLVGAMSLAAGVQLVRVDRVSGEWRQHLGGPVRLPPLSPGLSQAL